MAPFIEVLTNFATTGAHLRSPFPAFHIPHPPAFASHKRLVTPRRFRLSFRHQPSVFLSFVSFCRPSSVLNTGHQSPSPSDPCSSRVPQRSEERGEGGRRTTLLLTSRYPLEALCVMAGSEW